jgi:hypothetical protein
VSFANVGTIEGIGLEAKRAEDVTSKVCSSAESVRKPR